MRSSMWTASVAALAFCGVTQLWAQDKPATDRDDATTPKRAAGDSAHEKSGDSAHEKSTDNTIASCLMISNQEEIALATLAVSHAENPKVKQLAEMMIKDHQKCLNELKAFGGDVAMLKGAGKANESAGLPRRAAAATPADKSTETRRTAARDAEGLNFLDLKRQMAEKCVQSAEKQWNEHRGPEGDKCFVGTQVVMHQQMLDALEVLKQHASPKLQAEIEKSIEGTTAHLKHAEELMKELASTSKATQQKNN
jgi:predicted outer membrane protein